MTPQDLCRALADLTIGERLIVADALRSQLAADHARMIAAGIGPGRRVYVRVDLSIEVATVDADRWVETPAEYRYFQGSSRGLSK